MKNKEEYIYLDTINRELNESSLFWGNLTGSFRWNHVFNQKLFSNTTLIYSNYNFNTANNIENETFTIHLLKMRANIIN